MKKWYVALFLFLSSLLLSAQITTTFNYDWLRNPQWDKAVDEFNFAHTGSKEKLPYLTSGMSLSVGYLQSISAIRSSYLHYRVNMARYASGVQLTNWNLQVRLFRLDAETTLQFHPKALFKDVSAGPMGTRYFMYVGLFGSIWQSRASVNEERFFAKGTQPVVVRPGLLIGTGYHWIMLKKKWVITPRAGVRWFYQAQSPRMIEAITGSNVMNLAAATNKAFVIETGIEIGWLSSKPSKGKGKPRPCPNC